MKLPTACGALLICAMAGVAACDPISLLEPGFEEQATVHDSAISVSETWRAADNPHKVVGHVIVAGPSSPVLTIEPGVEIRFAAGAELQIGASLESGWYGGLNAVGTSSKPIELLAEVRYRSKGYWRGVAFRPTALPSRLEHVTIRDCGGGPSALEACLRLIGSGTTLTAKSLMVVDSKTYGIAAMFGSGFGPGSEEVSVRNTIDAAIRIDPDQAGTLPVGGTFGGDRGVVIQLSAGDVTSSQTWPNLGIPYMVTRDLRIGGPDGPVLTLQPGTELLIGHRAVLEVAPNDLPGGLVAVGNAEAPIRFTSLQGTSGEWKGLLFHPLALPESRLRHTVVHGGGFATDFGRGNVTFRRDIGPVIENSTIRDSAGCGIVRVSSQREWSTDFQAPALNNIFRDNPSGDQCTN